jgi:hypothetical protein
MTNSYYIDQRQGNSADTLLATGFARLVEMMLRAVEKPSDEVTLVDCGPYYRVDLPVPIETTDIQSLHSLPLVAHLDTKSQEAKLGRHYGDGFPYDRERERRDEYRESRKALPPEARARDAILRGHPALEKLSPPDPLLPSYLVINQMKVAASFNEAVIRWRELSPELLRVHVQLLLNLFSIHPNPLDDTVATYSQLAKQHDLGSPDMTMLQVVNPTTGKGANRTKANGLSIGGQREFWLLELLKFAGFFALAHPHKLQKSSDRKTYVLRPRLIEIGKLDRVMRNFRSLHWSSTPAKIDVLAALELTRVLVNIERSALQREQGDLRRRSPRPSERIQGLDVTFYKDMGSAFAVLNVAAINVPEWVPGVTSVAEADRVLDILKEHVEVVSSIRASDGEERNEEYELLRRYRDFLSGHDIEPFLDFAAFFAPYLSRKIERGSYIRRFNFQTLKELIAMAKPDFVRVIENEGFLHIADAIRRSTVSLQYLKGMKKPVDFDIRYGLAQDLVRSSNDTDSFVAALSDFVARYNNESAQEYETSKGAKRRRRVSQEDLAAFLQLLNDGHSPKTLARLLVAFGSSKVRGDESEPVSPEAIDADKDSEN